jgi:L-asparaginase II
LDEEEKARVTLGITQPSLIQCECSGKHAGMLATCRHRGWPVEDYLDPEHPLQQEIRAIIAAACGVPADSLNVATDGCSLPTYGAPLRAFAAAYAVLADPDGADWDGSQSYRAALLRVRGAITEHPDLMSGDGEIDTTKLGAEGLLCMAAPDRRLGIAISDSVGSERGLGPGAVAVLRELELVDGGTLATLEQELCPTVQTFAGKTVGETRPVLVMSRA